MQIINKLALIYTALKPINKYRPSVSEYLTWGFIMQSNQKKMKKPYF